jgi:hypothetical protein
LRLARRPRGGSVVSLMPFCRTVTGKYCAGIEVKNRRKSGCIASGS